MSCLWILNMYYNRKISLGHWLVWWAYVWIGQDTDSSLSQIFIVHSHNHVIIIIIIIIIIISFMQGTYTHIPETDYVPREHGVAAILLFLFMVLVSLLAVLNLLYFYISTFRSMFAVPNMAVFCSSLTSLLLLLYLSRTLFAVLITDDLRTVLYTEVKTWGSLGHI